MNNTAFAAAYLNRQARGARAEPPVNCEAKALMNIAAQAVNCALKRINPRWTLQASQPLSRRASLLRVRSSEEGELKRLVLLSHGAADRAANPDIARDEFRLLALLNAAGLPVAGPLALIENHEPPFLITSFVEGAPRFTAGEPSAFCQQLAAALSDLHAADIRSAFLPRLPDVFASTLEARQGNGRVRAVLRSALVGVRWNESVLLHGDFWLGNLLWQGDQLCGVIDWEDAMLGDPLADLGKSRLEMLWALGEGAAREYTAHYLALNPQLDVSALPFWDLWGAARLSHYASFAGDPAKAAAMRQQYDRFIQAAFDALAASQK